MKIEEVYQQWLFEFKMYMCDHGTFLRGYFKIRSDLNKITEKMKSFNVIIATTLRTRINDEMKIVAKLHNSGRTVFFNESCIPTETGKIIYLLDFEEKISKKGNAYVSCESWTDEDPLAILRKTEDGLRISLKTLSSEAKRCFNEIHIQHDRLKTIRFLERIDKTTGNWMLIIIASKYKDVIDDSIIEKFKKFNVEEMENVMSFIVVFKNDDKEYNCKVDKDIEISQSNNIIGFLEDINVVVTDTYT